MPVIQVNDKQHTLAPGQTRIGGGSDVDVSVSSDAALGVQAVLELADNNQVVIRRARDGAMVKVNGVVLGVEPTPLMHGDKVDVGGTEILFSEDKKVGATAFVSAAEVALIAAKRSGPARATASTGGRLVSLVDGKEYQIPAAGVVFGREAGSDIVVAQPEVSRRHASIAPSETGYLLQDLSTNGVWVNGTRIQGSQLLARSDVVRVGSEEFRFYADLAPAAKPTPSSVPSAGNQSQPTPVVPTPTQSASPAAMPSHHASSQGPAAIATPSQSGPSASASLASRAEPPTIPARAEPSTAPSRAEPSTAPSRAEPSTAPSRAQPSPAPSRAQPATSPSNAEPTLPVRLAGVATETEPPTAPTAAKPRPQPPRPKKEAVSATNVAKQGGVPSWLWLVIIVIVAVAAYFAGKGIG